jgi:uncharacterized protein (TIGR04255 family)
MPFPESQRVIYRKNPLGEVICQLKFPTILQIKAEVPSKFQERIRSDFPLYEAEEATIPIPRDMPKKLVQLFSQFSKPLAGDDIDHRFISEDGNRIITLNPDFLALTDKCR